MFRRNIWSRDKKNIELDGKIRKRIRKEVKIL